MLSPLPYLCWPFRPCHCIAGTMTSPTAILPTTQGYTNSSLIYFTFSSHPLPWAPSTVYSCIPHSSPGPWLGHFLPGFWKESSLGSIQAPPFPCPPSPSPSLETTFNDTKHSQAFTSSPDPPRPVALDLLSYPAGISVECWQLLKFSMVYVKLMIFPLPNLDLPSRFLGVPTL